MIASVKIAPSTYVDVVHFMFHEAELLDGFRMKEWLGLLTKDIDYRIPVRSVGRSSAISDNMAFHMASDYAALSARIAKLEQPSSLAEDPVSRMRHFVSNVRAENDADRHEIRVVTNLLVYRQRGEAPPVLVSGERRDVLRLVDGSLRIAKRLVLLDHTVLPAWNIIVL